MILNKLLKDRALLPLASCPGVGTLWQAEGQEIWCRVEERVDVIRYTMLPGQPIHVQGSIYRRLVEERSGDRFWLLVCTIHRTGLVFWPGEFSA